MVLDTLERSAAYHSLHPLFARAFEFLRSTDLHALPPGRQDIDGDRLFVSIDHVDGRGRERARLEAHRRYIDIQVTLAGDEQIGWRPLAGCTPSAFDADRDIGFMDDTPESWFALLPGSFAIFFPADAHAPLTGRGPVRKAIVKVMVEG